jgi:hypothetical protein
MKDLHPNHLLVIDGEGRVCSGFILTVGGSEQGDDQKKGSELHVVILNILHP